MNIKFKTTIIFTSAALFLLITFVSKAANEINISSLGTLSCGNILEDTKNPIRSAEISDWLNGFVTGYNFYNHDTQLKLPDKATNIAFIENFCRNNPLKILVSGGAVLVEDLGGQKVKFPYK